MTTYGTGFLACWNRTVSGSTSVLAQKFDANSSAVGGVMTVEAAAANVGGKGNDQIVAGEGTNVIDLHLVDADINTAGDQAFTFIGDSEFTGAAGQLRLVFFGTTTSVVADVSGGGVGNTLFILDGDKTGLLTAADFIL
ncbi:MAG: hypothetical protein ACXW3D_08035 [Caulobacteraceae bacterium]